MPNELLEKGRLLDQLGRYDDAWAAFAEGKRLARELSGQAYLDDEARQQIDRLRDFFTAGRLRLLPRAARARGRAAADLHPGLPALRHHAGGADAVGASEDRRRRRTAADPRDHRDHAAHAGKPARLSRGAGRAVDGRPARGARQSARLLPAEGPPDGRAARGRDALHRQDAAERDASRPDRAAVPRGAADPRAAPSARHHGVGVLQPVHPRLLLRL